MMNCIQLCLMFSLINFGASFPNLLSENWNKSSTGYQALAKNVTIDADQVTVTNNSFSARHLVIRADEIVINRVPKDQLSFTEGEYEVIEYPELHSSIDKTLNPCDDFYEFVCHGWLNSHEIPAYRLSMAQMDRNQENIALQLRDILEKSKRNSEIKGAEIFYNVYDKCMDQDKRNRLKSQPLFNTLRKIKKANMKFVTDWMIAVWPIALFYSFEVYADLKNATLNKLNLIPAKSVFPPEYFLDERFEGKLKSFESYLSAVLKIIVEDDLHGEFFKVDEIPRRISSLITIDKEIASIENRATTSGLPSDHNFYYNLHSIADLHILAPSVSWKKFILGILPTDVQANLSLDSLQINIPDVESVKNMEKMTRQLSAPALSDYLDWRIILSQVDFLDDRYANARRKYEQEALGISETEPDWMTCQTVTVTLFPDIANYLYIQNYFPYESRTELDRMIEHIRQAFKSLLRESKWLDDETRSLALLKADSIIGFIGYDRKLMDKDTIEGKYAELLQVISWNYVSIVHAAKRWNHDLSFRKLVSLNTRDTFEFPAPEANAFYDPTRNQIVLLAGILQEAFFNRSFPIPLNYGGIGVVIGHEITHAFDNEGSQYDEVGNLENWWDNSTASNFRELQGCFIEQYGSIEVPNTNGMKIDGWRTLTENLADNGGIRAAYKAMKTALDKQEGKEKRIKGLEEYGSDQLFFINFAYTWCSQTRPEAVPLLLISDDHSPDRQRVNAAVHNQDEFLEAFSCPSGASGLPEGQCRLW